MDAYTAFSKVYDTLMENVPYETWADMIDEWIKEYGISRPVRNASDPLESERNLVLDVGCGTGILTRLMFDKGYDLIGVDISPEMLEIANEAEQNRDEPGIMYICQDMCELDLYSTVGTVYSSCDTVNYLLEDEEVEACFKGVAKFLYPGGLFIFDFNTIHKYRDLIGETTIAENDDEVSFIWDNCFDEESGINECDLTLFIKTDGGDNLYEKQEETHYQRGFTIEEIRDFLGRAGLSIVKITDERDLGRDEVESGEESGEDSERIFVVARKEA